MSLIMVAMGFVPNAGSFFIFQRKRGVKIANITILGARLQDFESLALFVLKPISEPGSVYLYLSYRRLMIGANNRSLAPIIFFLFFGFSILFFGFQFLQVANSLASSY